MDLTSFLLVFVPLLVIVDPFASLGLFLGLTQGMDQPARMRIVTKAGIFASVVLVLFAFMGTAMLEYLGIRIYALQAAGGLLLVMIGLAMLKEGREIPRREIQLQTGGDYDPVDAQHHDPSFVPLGLPMMAGPGAISLVIVSRTEFGLTTVTFAVAATMAITAALLAVATKMQKLLGRNGARVITRIMGILTVAFAMQYLFDGAAGWLAEL